MFGCLFARSSQRDYLLGKLKEVDQKLSASKGVRQATERERKLASAANKLKASTKYHPSASCCQQPTRMHSVLAAECHHRPFVLACKSKGPRRVWSRQHGVLSLLCICIMLCRLRCLVFMDV
jgi:hypothetical protein